MPTKALPPESSAGRHPHPPQTRLATPHAAGEACTTSGASSSPKDSMPKAMPVSNSTVPVWAPLGLLEPIELIGSSADVSTEEARSDSGWVATVRGARWAWVR